MGFLLGIVHLFVVVVVGVASQPDRDLPDQLDRDLPVVVPGCGVVVGGKKGGPHVCGAPLEVGGGGVLLSHTLASAVPSACPGLASGFGMGPGVSLEL